MSAETVLWILLGVGLYIYVVCLLTAYLRRNKRRYPLLRERPRERRFQTRRQRERDHIGTGFRRRD